MLAWYFGTSDKTLRYGGNRKIVIGKSHTIEGIPELCKVGLHGSVNLLDALKHAPGAMLYRVDITRHLDIGEDKLCGQRRKYLAGFDATAILQEFARKQALINIEKIKPHCSAPDYTVIINWLTTGKEEYRSAAWSASWSAARSAAWSASATWSASAAWSAAESAARSASWSAARSAAWSAAESAAWSAAAASAAWSAATEAAANIMLIEMVEKHLGEIECDN